VSVTLSTLSESPTVVEGGITERRTGPVLLAAAAPLYFLVLVVNAAVPGWLGPTMGIPVWHIGFATSLSHGSVFDVYARDVGLPDPAAQAFGLPGSIAMSWLLRAGLPGADAYALGYALFLAAAFAAAVAFVRMLGLRDISCLLAATVWLTLPVVFVHAGYAMLGVGIALLPAYSWSAARLLDPTTRLVARGPTFVALAVVSVFLDGYTFVMFACASGALAVHALWQHGVGRLIIARLGVLCFGFAAAYLLYDGFIAADPSTSDLDFFRAFGVDLTFLAIPTEGVGWLWDWMGISQARPGVLWWADYSPRQTTFIGPLIAVSVVLALGFRGDWRIKVTLLAVGIVALYLALGPSFKIGDAIPANASVTTPSDVNMPARFAHGPTGTAFLWEHVPGFESMRAVYRWTALAAFGFWGALSVALTDRRLRRVAPGLLIALLLINIPPLTASVPRTAASHDQMRQAEKDLRREAQLFQPGERVLFLPVRNDFLINWFAPLAGIRAFNIGGDKNFTSAQRAWPEQLQMLRGPHGSLSTAGKVVQILADREVDAVAISRIDLLAGAHQWPPPAHKQPEVPLAGHILSRSPVVTVNRGRYFDIVRLRGGATGEEVRRYLARDVVSDCVQVTAQRRQPALRPGATTPLTQELHPCDSGWSKVEDWGRWIADASATQRLALDPVPEPSRLIFAARSELAPDARVRVRVQADDSASATWTFTRADGGQHWQEISLPPNTSEVVITFARQDPPPLEASDERHDAGEPRIALTSVCHETPQTSCAQP